MWEIRPTNGKYECVTSAIVAFAESNNIEFEMMLWPYWGFQTKPGDELVLYCGGRWGYDNLRYFHGITLDKKKFEGKRELELLLASELKQGPVMISVDAYDCPWCATYKKYRMEHSILIAEYMDETIYCVDSYFPSDGIIEWNIKSNDWSGDLTAFRVSEVKRVKEDYILEIQAAIDYFETSDAIGEIMTFYSRLAKVTSFSEIRERYKRDYFAIPLLINLKHISMCRTNSVMALEYMGRKLHANDLFTKAGDSFKEAAIAYKSFKSVIMKQIIKNEVNPQMNEKLINNIITIERNSLNECKKIVELLDVKEK